MGGCCDQFGELRLQREGVGVVSRPFVSRRGAKSSSSASAKHFRARTLVASQCLGKQAGRLAGWQVGISYCSIPLAQIVPGHCAQVKGPWRAWELKGEMGVAVLDCACL